MPDPVAPLAAWKRGAAWTRVAFALAGVGSVALLPSGSSTWALAASVAFLVFSLLVPLKKNPGSAFGLLVLFVDAVFFLALVGTSIGAELWLPAFYYACLLAEAALLYRPPEVLVVAVFSAIFCLAVQSQYASSIRRATVTAGILAYVFSLYKKRLDSRAENLALVEAETREDARLAREAERQRIASDFHDGPLQSFISLQMRLEILRKLLERDTRAGMDDLTDLQKLAQQQVKELRAFVRGMRPPEVQGSNLYASARRICENFQKESGIPVTFVSGDGSPKFPEEMASEIIQMLREALHNVLKHAAATRLAVSLERAGKVLVLSVDDNGQGFHFSGVYSLDELELLRLGPASLKRRARTLNAEMTVESRPGRGAGLKVRIPVP